MLRIWYIFVHGSFSFFFSHISNIFQVCPYFRTQDNRQYCRLHRYGDIEKTSVKSNRKMRRSRKNLYITALIVVLISFCSVVTVGSLLYQRSVEVHRRKHFAKPNEPNMKRDAPSPPSLHSERLSFSMFSASTDASIMGLAEERICQINNPQNMVESEGGISQIGSSSQYHDIPLTEIDNIKGNRERDDHSSLYVISFGIDEKRIGEKNYQLRNHLSSSSSFAPKDIADRNEGSNIPL